jgi:hypothetical protein
MRLDDALVILQTVWLRHIAILSPCDSMMHRAHITILSTCGAFYTSPCNHHSCDFDRDIMILMLKKRRQPPSMTTKDGRSYRNVPIPNETKIFARRSKHFRVIQWGSMHLPSLHFMLPKRRFWNAELTFQSACSKHFSTFCSPNLVLTTLKSAAKKRSEMFVRPSKIFVWGAYT